MAFDYPELHGPITIDTENHDPKLKDRGSGWPYRKTGENGGKIIGIAYHSDSTPLGGYAPIGHLEGNEDPVKVKKWLTYQLTKDEKQPTIFANALYDVGWLTAENIKMNGPIEDIMFQAPLLDESRMNYQLERLGKDYLGEGKDETLLKAEAARLGIKNTKKDNIKAHLMKIHPNIVGIYGTQDAVLTRKLWDFFKPKMEAEELMDVYRLETDLIPMLIAMRMRGVRVDVDQCRIEQAKLTAETEISRRYIDDKTGIKIGSWDNADELSRVLDKMGIKYGLTEKTQRPSITAGWLKSLNHPIADAILRGRKTSNIRSTFLENAMLNLQEDGRIYPNFNPLRKDDDASSGVLGKELKSGTKGAVSGRFSSSDPNFQQIPSPEKDPDLGYMVRKLILPEEGEQFHVMDYSSQEPRLIVHFAELTHCRKAGEMADRFRANPNTDLHDETRAMVATALPEWEDKKFRKPAKVINLGVAYGMGGGKLAFSLGMDYTMSVWRKNGVDIDIMKPGSEAQELLNLFDREAPFIKELAMKAQKAVKDKGYIKTPLGRRFRFPKDQYGAYQFLNKALNRLIQGSAADMTKLAMRELWKEGILPLGCVHDEIDISTSDPKIVARTKEIMEHALPLNIPVIVDVGSGNNWGDASM